MAKLGFIGLGIMGKPMAGGKAWDHSGMVKALYRQGAKNAKIAKEPQSLFAFLGVLCALGALAVNRSIESARS